MNTRQARRRVRVWAGRLAAPLQAPLRVDDAPAAGRRIGPVLAIALGALMLMAAILANGRPTVFPDTDDYFMEGESIVETVVEHLFQGKPIVSREMWRDHFGRDGAGDE